MAVITKTTVEGVDTYAEEGTTLFESIVNGATMPLKAVTAEDGKFYSSKDAGIAALGWGIGGLVLGHKYGASIPLINKL